MTIEIPPLQPPWSRLALVNDNTALFADETMEALDEHYTGKANAVDVDAALATKADAAATSAALATKANASSLATKADQSAVDAALATKADAAATTSALATKADAASVEAVAVRQADIALAAGRIPSVPAALPPACMSQWRRGLRMAAAGRRRARVLMVGDSTVLGYGATPLTGSFPYKFLTPLGLVDSTAYASGVPQRADSANDGRWGFSTDWAFGNNGTSIGFGGRAYYGYTKPTGSSAGPLWFEPKSPIDTFTILYAVDPGNFDACSVGYAPQGGGTRTALADLNMSVGPVTAGITNGSGQPIGWGQKTYTVPKGSQRILIGPNVGGPVTTKSMFILGIIAWDSTAFGIDVINAGASSSTSSEWNTPNISGAYSGTLGIRTVAPDLTVIMLGINDDRTSIPVATTIANLTALIAAAKLSGSVLLMTSVPSGTSEPGQSMQDPRNAAIRSLAEAQGVGLVDIFARQGSYAVNQAKGFAADTIGHLNDNGYADLSAAVGIVVRDGS